MHMAAKPTRPDRRRSPVQCRRAWALFVFALVLTLAVFSGVLFWYLNENGMLLAKWVGFLLFLLLVLPAAINVYRVQSRWYKLVLEHEGLLCPMCAYPLTGLRQNAKGITCSECGHVTTDTAEVRAYWLEKTHRGF